MRSYAIGLDIGITSVGWAAVALDGKENPCGIIDMGVRIFDAAEIPKTGASLAAPRREARSSRRRLRRHRHRNERIRYLFLTSGLVTEDELEHLYDGKLEDIYGLRVRALDERVTNAELARILIHIAQHRGFKSNRINGSSPEDGKLLNAVEENEKRMKDRNYRTAGEMLLRDPAFAGHKRNKGGVYLTTVSRDMVEDEVRKIFATQRKNGSEYATENLENDYLEIMLSQRSFDEGPGGNSPYGGDQILGKVGNCTLMPEEKRAAKATYSFEYFNLLSKINSIRLITNEGSEPLTAEQRNRIAELAHKTENLDYAKIRKELALPDEYIFNTVRYEKEEDREACEKKNKFSYLKCYHEMRKAIDRREKGRFALFTEDQRNTIGTVLTLYKTSERIRGELEKAGFEKEDIEALERLSGFSKFGHISLKACRALIPYLEKGFVYNEACEKAGIEFKGHAGNEKSFLLHPTDKDYEDVTSPVVRRAVAQSIKVINAIIRKQGKSPVYINIELARELAKSRDERNKISKKQEENRSLNEKIIDQLKIDFNITDPTGQDIVKLKLYHEQNGISPYSQKSFDINRLFEEGYAEVDHIIPYSISFDDSYKNKTLVFANENRDKGRRLPLEYLTGKKRDDFIVWVNNSVRDFKKKKQYLREKVTEADKKEYKERSLQDTKTISVFMMNYIRDNLAFDPSSSRKKRVTAVNGIMTAYMRKRWGVTKIREDGDIHHAVDALCVACTTDSMIQSVSRYSSWRELEYVHTEDMSYAVDPETGEIVKSFPYPWAQFREELKLRTEEDPEPFRKALERLPMYYGGEIAIPDKPIFISRMPNRKVTGAAHEDTIKSPRLLDEGKVVVKQPLTKLKLKDGEIKDYYDPSSDRLLYEALKKRLTLFDGNADKAFAEPFYKPKKNGTRGPRVDKVKLCEKVTSSVPVLQGKGVADNEQMVRIDVFYVENDGYYFVPIYVADTLKPELPNKACVRKPTSEWKEMDDKDFVFSLYKNDLIRIVREKPVTMKLKNKTEESKMPDNKDLKCPIVYYQGADISTCSIDCITHDNAYFIHGLGIKSLGKIEKYTVGVLGEYNLVKKEKRQSFSFKRG